MQQLHLQEEEALKSQRVTEAEAQQIVQLWAEAQKQAATQSGPTVHDIAEGLEIPPEEAIRLLQQVRQKQIQQVETQVQTRNRTPIFFAAVVMALIAVMLMAMLVSFRFAAPPPLTATPAETVIIKGEGATPGAPSPVPPSTIPPPGHPSMGLPR